MHFRQPTLRFKRALIHGVLLAFVLAQALGLMHRIVHAPFVGQAAAHASAEAPRAEMSWLKALFSGHDSERDCHLYDQAGHADLACGDAPSLALQGPVAAADVLLHPGWQLAAQAAGFLARGPPAAV
ncbi:MAG: hypothetical protein ABI671_06615 [Burkholderiales bacterium]